MCVCRYLSFVLSDASMREYVARTWLIAQNWVLLKYTSGELIFQHLFHAYVRM